MSTVGDSAYLSHGSAVQTLHSHKRSCSSHDFLSLKTSCVKLYQLKLKDTNRVTPLVVHRVPSVAPTAAMSRWVGLSKAADDGRCSYSAKQILLYRTPRSLQPGIENCVDGRPSRLPA